MNLVGPPQRAFWLSTAILVSGLVVAERAGLLVPFPFLLLLLSVAASGALGGVRSGVIAGLLMSVFIVYSWLVDFGPSQLTGTPIRVALGCIVTVGLGAYIGAIRDQLTVAVNQLEQKREDLTQPNRDPSNRVIARTARHEAITEQLLRNQDLLRGLARRWVEAEESERQRIARHLHDDAGQCLTALRINLACGKAIVQADPRAAELIENSIELVDAVIESLRKLSAGLRPALLDDIGLAAAIKEHVSKQINAADIDFELVVSGDERKIDSHASITAFRLTQQAVDNVLKHAEATNLTVDLRIRPEMLELVILDDGVGFDIDTLLHESQHHGIAGMRERANMIGGKLNVTSKPGKGTRVHIALPLENECEAASAARILHDTAPD